MLVSALPRMLLGVSAAEARIRIGTADGAPPHSDRYLLISDRPAFELSYWCGTCPLLFERKYGANETLNISSKLQILETAVRTLDRGIIETFSSLLPQGEYLPLLLRFRPELVAPHARRDYFTHEQIDTWGVDPFWGLPQDPRSFYYRTHESVVDANQHLYEFVVPMVPPSWNTPERVQEYDDSIRRGQIPTAVALTLLDVRQPATDGSTTDYYTHWCLSHFLLDGHHKLHAAAMAGAAIQLIALVSVDHSLATSDEIERVPDLLSRPKTIRRQ